MAITTYISMEVKSIQVGVALQVFSIGPTRQASSWPFKEVSLPLPQINVACQAIVTDLIVFKLSGPCLGDV